MTGDDVADRESGDDATDPGASEGRFLVTHADADSAVLKDVESGQVHTLGDNPGVEEHDVIEATVAPEPPMEVTWRVTEVRDRRSLRVEESDEPPTAHERELADGQEVGDLTRRERAGEGEIHVLTVPPDGVEAAVADVLGDEGTLARAARLGVARVEVRSTTADGHGVVSVRYMP
ncbi:MAG: DUF5812 family protein [Haloarculaceae archaeon]